MAYYCRRHLVPGGALALSEERRFQLRPHGMFGTVWKLSRRDGREFTRIAITRHGRPARTWLLSLDQGAAGEPEGLAHRAHDRLRHRRRPSTAAIVLRPKRKANECSTGVSRPGCPAVAVGVIGTAAAVERAGAPSLAEGAGR
jgi:hypothetical protein